MRGGAAAGPASQQAPRSRTTGSTGRPAGRPAGPPPPRPRLTGRAAILVLVLAVLAVSYASSLRAYLQQRAHINDLQATIASGQGEIDSLEREKSRWKDAEYVAAQARERLGYVRPGETPFVVLQDGRPLESEGSLTDPDSIAQEPPRAWYSDVWDSMKVAGDPPRKVDPRPETLIEPEESRD